MLIDKSLYCLPSIATCQTVLQFHLVLSDAVATLVMIALLIIHSYGSILFLTFISVHRYVAVVHDKRSSCMKPKGFVQKFGCYFWLKGWLVFFFGTQAKVGNRTHCLSIHQVRYIEVYFVINFILLTLGVLLAFSVSLTYYIQLVNVFHFYEQF